MRYALIFSLVALPAFAQDNGVPDTEAEPPVGGVGRLACAAIVGPENAAYLGQAGDWALGYMAGRIDAGEEVTGGATLSPDDTVDVVSGIAVRCRENPDQPVIEAVRAFAERVFGAEAQAGPVTADAPPPPADPPEGAASAEPPRQSVAPEPRPEAASASTEEGVTSEDERPSTAGRGTPSGGSDASATDDTTPATDEDEVSADEDEPSSASESEASD